MESNTTMESDFKELLFTIEIGVYNNCQMCKIVPKDKKLTTYQAIIGALEIQKQSMIIEQSSTNIKEFIKSKEEEKKVIKSLKKE